MVNGRAWYCTDFPLWCMLYVAGTDYVGGIFNVCFPINVARVSLPITIINDDKPPLEEDEKFRINFIAVPSGAIGGVYATVTIQDDCTQECQNGGTLNSSTCVCACTADYTGLSCEGEFVTTFCMTVCCTDTQRMGTTWHNGKHQCM